METVIHNIFNSFDVHNRQIGEKSTIIITDKHLTYPGPQILFVAGDIEGLTGYSIDELIGKTPRLFQGPGTDKSELVRLRQVCERGDYYEGSLVNYRKDGTPFLMGLAISPIRVDGNIEYYFAIQSDITSKEITNTLAVIRTRIDVINKSLDVASQKLTYSVDNIRRLLKEAMAARHYRRHKQRSIVDRVYLKNSPVSFGGLDIKVIAPDDVAAVISHALAIGINLFDCTGCHKILADTLRGKIREDFFIQVISVATTNEAVRIDLDDFKRELDTDYIDCMLLHTNHDWRLSDAPRQLQYARDNDEVKLIGVYIDDWNTLLSSCVCGSMLEWVDIVLVNFDRCSNAVSWEQFVDALKWLHHLGKIIVATAICVNDQYDRVTYQEALLKVIDMKLCSAVFLGIKSPVQLDDIIAITP